MMLPSLPSRLVVLATIFLMVLLQTLIFMMSDTKEQTESQEMATKAATLDPGSANYPFLKDPQTVKYISTQIKVMIFLHVASDKEMSALAQAITSTYKDSATCCLKTSRGSEVKPFGGIVYHRCQDQIEDSCKKGVQVIVVNGTENIPSDLQDCFTLAHRYNYTTLVVQPNATSGHPGAAHGSHSELMQETLRTANAKPKLPTILYPFFYGWFLGFNISVDTLGFGKTIFKECLQQPKFVEIFTKYAIPGSPRNASGGLDFDRYFSLEGFITGTTLLHCTSFFSNYSERAGSQQYATSPAVRQATGRAFNLTVIGFLITPRTLGARIRLNDQELLLWETNSSATSDFTPVGAGNNVDKTMQQKQLQHLDQSQMPGQEISTFYPIRDEVPCPKGWRPTEFSPTCGRGSRAHLTLGTGKDVEAVQTGSDLNAIIQRELEAVAKKEDILTLKLKSGTVRCYGEGNWAVYLDKALEIGTLFTGWY
ncbi:2',3'-cyclic-nucleotide 3'-phosphodiesterase-like isoform X2 [Patiria miniata]|nr:2',3'-cyclic-nucleotide 3'-phosphodiesterase-like isoform X2 [Patiria miniata]XP_038071957.1 2',3'-cyclic-nucleotide 3'-phosphodiesterase-like isoform X2 [Patiria miniata]